MEDPKSKDPQAAPPRAHAAPSSRPWRPTRAIGLARALLKAGYGTRRQAEAMVVAGRVRVADEIVRDPRHTVEPGAEIFLDDERLQELDLRYFALHKPLRVASAGEQAPGRAPVADFFPHKVMGLAPAGRMDSMTSGLLLVSNDSQWNNMITTTPGLEQEYRIQVEGELTELEINVISAGVHLPGRSLFKPESVRIVECLNDHTIVNMTVREGKIRQVRKMLATLRHKVTLVRRVRIGEIRLVDLSVGGYRELSAPEVESIRRIRAAVKAPSGGKGGA